jgi:hypothetical protein
MLRRGMSCASLFRSFPVGMMLATLALGGCASSGSRAAFERALSADHSATAALRGWCAARHIADPATILATPLPGPPQALPAGLRAALAIAPDEPLRYRHVALSCGGTVLSVAHNWYVPALLTAEMNRLLDSTPTPFGTVVAPLHFRREALPRTRKVDPDCPAGTILAHRAILRAASGLPISLVIECYARANLGGS